MSLINQMLKDLEKRRQQEFPSDDLPPSIQVVEVMHGNPWLRALYGVVLGVALVVAAWFWHAGQTVQQKSTREASPIQSELGIKPREPISPVASGLPTLPPQIAVTPNAVESSREVPSSTGGGLVSNTVKIRDPLPSGDGRVRGKTFDEKTDLMEFTSPSALTPTPLPRGEGLNSTALGLGRWQDKSEASLLVKRPHPKLPPMGEGAATEFNSPAIGKPQPKKGYPPARAESAKNQTGQDSLNRIPALSAPVDATADQLYQRGARYYSAGQLPRAIDLLERSLLLDPTQNAVRLQLAKSYAANGDINHAADMLASIPGYASDIQTEKMRALILMKQGLNEQAETLLDQALNNYRGDPELRSMKAALDQRLGNHQEAVDLYHTLIQEQPTKSKWWLGLAISLEAQERFEEARDAYQRALATGAPNRQSQDYIESRIQALQGGGNGRE